MEQLVLALAVLSVGALFGGMTFFAAVFAPLVFIKLDGATAGRFIRQVFPVYYLAMAVASGAAAALLAWSSRPSTRDAIAMAAVCVAFILARQVLMPMINDSRDALLAVDKAESPDTARAVTLKKRFDRLHGLSVLINMVQLVGVMVILARFVWPSVAA